jgi:ABC-type lipoprotein release transport system permease subunit
MIGETKIPFFLVKRFLWHGNKWTLALIIFLMSIAFINLVFVTSLFNGIIESANNQVIDTNTGHIMMMPAEGKEFIKNIPDVTKKIKEIAGVTAVSPQNFSPARISYKKITGNWQVVAIDPELEKGVTIISSRMMEGSYLDKDDTDKIIIGRQIAGGNNIEMNALSFKGARAGEKVTLSIGPIQKDFLIKGVFYTKFIDTDLRAFISQKALDKLVPFYKDSATNVIIRINKTGAEKETIKKMDTAPGKKSQGSWSPSLRASS